MTSRFHPFLACPKCKKLRMAEMLIEKHKNRHPAKTSKDMIKDFVCQSCGHRLSESSS